MKVGPTDADLVESAEKETADRDGPRHPVDRTCPVEGCNGRLSRSYALDSNSRSEEKAVCHVCGVGSVVDLTVRDGDPSDRTLRHLKRNRQKLGFHGEMYPDPSNASSVAAIIDSRFPTGDYQVCRVGPYTTEVDLPPQCQSVDVGTLVTAWYDGDNVQSDWLEIEDVAVWYDADQGHNHGFTLRLSKAQGIPHP